MNRFFSKNKYNNTKIKLDGHTFDSRLELLRYKELKILEEAGKIKNLVLQPEFELMPKVKYKNQTYRVTKYIGDFLYEDLEGNLIVEDTKGFETDVYKLKRKLFLIKYGDKYDFREIRK